MTLIQLEQLLNVAVNETETQMRCTKNQSVKDGCMALFGILYAVSTETRTMIKKENELKKELHKKQIKENNKLDAELEEIWKQENSRWW